jgi:tetratricopeptide (TPR) repeat protein
MKPVWPNPTPYVIAVAALLVLAYSNHFSNGFHFDDDHAIEQNPYVRSISYIPRYFADATTFSVLPLNQSYRPVLQTTFAIDYRLGGGYNPVAFQLDTFLWYLALLAAMAWLIQTIAHDRWLTLAERAIYALHPVNAETVNYIVQRGDLLSTFGVVAALALYLSRPHLRRYGVYLLLLAFAALVKPPALVFPALLGAYLMIFEPRARVLRAIAPSALAALALGLWLARMSPPTATTGASHPALYLLSQPYVALRYFLTFFVPAGLSADRDWQLVAGATDWRVAVGAIFVIATGVAIWSARVRHETRPIAFGLAWFVIALLPTSLTPLAEVANDHRMFFPFVGLAFAAAAAAKLVLARVAAPKSRLTAGVIVMACVLIAESTGVYARNAVWSSDLALWRDVTEKSPNNGRGWMNYGVALMERGDFAGAIAAYDHALPLTPNYHLLEVNIGVAHGQLHHDAEAERHFLRAIALEPADWRAHVHYARWLAAVHRTADALAHARLAREMNPADLSALPVERAAAPADNTADYYIARSLAEYQIGRFRDSLASATRATALQPSSAEAWNNVAAAHNALGQFDQGIAAGEKAVALNPSLEIARNNLAYARRQLQPSR